ncbi:MULTISPECIES: NAD(P)/FAD-dependent oxidoreductase [Acidobacteriaceae]|uniref:NAD(P)/FAD-dependent oxidoreductase n=1 Tax=Acidobacteriaceae TaxID=204434 RepID=UPI00131DF7C7|nr:MULTISPECIES: NAD(P)/FAD-dependent oxidoreductase [Acidobacteriaceae]MDW5265758.1 NAD(P)/FAD-dependent oxidoreductase [Edaphobacter sp.]
MDVVVLGGGAAGLMCAVEAGRRGRRVVLLDHAERVGKKILISGGGRCNFTNIHCRAENFLSENPHFAKSALARFTPADIIALVEKHGIRYHEKTLGQLFCDRSAMDVVAMLERECAEAGVRVVTGTKVLSVKQNEKFMVETSAGTFQAQSVVVATGGLSIPKMGATGFGYSVAEQFGLRVIECRPALVPLVMGGEDASRWCDLTGLSAEVVAAAGTKRRRGSFKEKMLVTHRGLSGPAILQVSSYWRAGEAVEVDLAPGVEVFAPLLVKNARRDAGAAVMALRTVLPGRMAERWVALHEPAGWTNTALAAMEQEVHTWRVVPAGTEGYAKAEVTAGGVDTAELDAKTMESRKVPGLYFIGEVVDVTGWLGGYNFQWAWASGVSAGRAV